MQIPRSYVENYSKALNVVSERARAQLADALARINYTADVAVVREAVIAVMQPACGASSTVAARLAAEFYDGLRARFGIDDGFMAEVDSRREPEATEGAVRASAQDLVDGKPAEQFISKCVDRIDYETRKAANECIAHNARNDPRRPRWARVPMGSETCSFCIMLASRGFVYHSEDTASHAHAHCDCRIVPSWDKGNPAVEGYDPDLYYDMWKHPEKYGERDFSEVRYGEYRGLSYIDDDLKSHVGDGTGLDPLEMVMGDTGFSEAEARQLLSDMYQWTGEGYSSIRRREGGFAEIADRLERFLADSPKYEGSVWRGIGVERSTADSIIKTLLDGNEIDQLGISSWATDESWAQEFGDMNLDRMDDGVKIIFCLENNRTGVSIKHIASAADNDEVIASESARYILNGNIEEKHDPYDGEFLFVPVREV